MSGYTNSIETRENVIKRWEKLGLINDDLDSNKREWMSEYAEMHKLDSNIHVNPYPDIDPYGEENWNDESTTTFENYAHNLLPVSMKIAAQTIGLDLVAVKPMSAPIIDLGFFDFKYGFNDNTNETKGQVFSDLDPYGEEQWEEDK